MRPENDIISIGGGEGCPSFRKRRKSSLANGVGKGGSFFCRGEKAADSGRPGKEEWKKGKRKGVSA